MSTSTSTASQMPTTPELDRQSKIIQTGKPGAVQDFIEWLDENGYVLARRCTEPIHRDRARLAGSPMPSYCGVCEGTGIVETHIDRPRMMASFFLIDLDKIEQERRALLDALRSAHQSSIDHDDDKKD